MKILAIAFKDLTRSYRNSFMVGTVIIAPLVLVGLIYFASGGTPELPEVMVGMVNADSLSSGNSLNHPLEADIRDLFFNESVDSWITLKDFADKDSALASLKKGEIDVAVIIPQGFSERVLAGERDTQVLIFSEPELTAASLWMQNIIAANLQGAFGGEIAARTLVQRYQAMGLQPDPTSIQTLMDRYARWYADSQWDMFHDAERAVLVTVAPSAKNAPENPVQKALGLMMAGQMVFFSFFSGAYAMMSILREDEEGTLARLFTTPVPRSSILGGKFVSVFLIVLVQGAVLIVAAHYAFELNWGDPLPVLLALTGQVIAAAGLGVFLISIVKTTQQAGPILGGGLTVLGILGGLFTVGLDMPEAFTKLSVFTPQGWVIGTWKAALSGQPFSEVVIPFIVITVMGTVMFAVGAMRFRQRFS